MWKLKLPCLFIIFCAINTNSVYAFKCDFQIINELYLDYYTCTISSIQSDIKEAHLPDNFDDDVSRISISLNSTDINDINYPFCQRFPNLRKVFISGLRSIDENLFKSCRNLMEIAIVSTTIEDLPEKLFANNKELITVILKNNKLRTLPEGIFTHNKGLWTIILDDNEIIELLPNIFKSLTWLDKLSLQNNKIKKMNPAWFEDLEQLDDLFLSNNKISELPKNVFKNLKKLDTLRINNNKLTTINSDSFGNNEELSFINLDNNKIDAIDGKIFEILPGVMISLKGNVCSSDILMRNDEELKKCIENYQPRK